MPQLKTKGDVKQWLREIYGEDGVLYKQAKLGKPEIINWKINPIYFDDVVDFRQTSYLPTTDKGKKRWEGEGPYSWALLLQTPEDYVAAWFLDARHHGYAQIHHMKRTNDLEEARATLDEYARESF